LLQHGPITSDPGIAAFNLEKDAERAVRFSVSSPVAGIDKLTGDGNAQPSCDRPLLNGRHKRSRSPTGLARIII